MAPRLAKLAMTASLALFAFLVAFSNVTDYAANWPFVEHVLSMDTTFKDPAVMYRAVDAPWLWTAGYWLIIAGEALTCVLFALAAWRLYRALEAPAVIFNRAKGVIHLAAAAGFLVWFTGFMAVGGEWFEMWQSQTWNGQEPAFRFYVTILLVTLYVIQPDGELA